MAMVLDTATCAPAEPQPAGQPVSATRSVAHLAKIEAAAATGDQQAVKEGIEALGGDLRRSMRIPDITRRIDPETARSAAKRVPGVRSVVWLDRENLFATVAANPANPAHRSRANIDPIVAKLTRWAIRRPSWSICRAAQTGSATNSKFSAGTSIG